MAIWQICWNRLKSKVPVDPGFPYRRAFLCKVRRMNQKMIIFTALRFSKIQNLQFFLSSAWLHRSVVPCARIHDLDGKLVCDEVFSHFALQFKSFLFTNLQILSRVTTMWWKNISNVFSNGVEKCKTIFWRNIEGQGRQARTWRPGRGITSPAQGGLEPFSGSRDFTIVS